MGATIAKPAEESLFIVFNGGSAAGDWLNVEAVVASDGWIEDCEIDCGVVDWKADEDA